MAAPWSEEKKKWCQLCTNFSSPMCIFKLQYKFKDHEFTMFYPFHSFTLQQQIARQNSIVKASKTSSTLHNISGETSGNQTKSKSDDSTRNLAKDS